jgi:hypothetical protein
LSPASFAESNFNSAAVSPRAPSTSCIMPFLLAFGCDPAAPQHIRPERIALADGAVSEGPRHHQTRHCGL